MRNLITKLAFRNLRSDWFGTLCAILGVALGTATVNVVLILDTNTRAHEASRWTTNPSMEVDLNRTVGLRGYRADGTPTAAEDPKEETHEDYQVMRSAIRLGSLSAFLVGALIVFFTLRVVVEERRREIALLRSLGADPMQVALVFALQATLIGLAGAFLGFVLSAPLAFVAAFMGITTTGRARLAWLWFPWGTMAIVTSIGAATTMLGVLQPVREILRLDVTGTLRSQSLEPTRARQHRRRGSSLTLIALPFGALLYILIRPFFFETLPSLAFFVLEATLVCAGLLSVLVLVPEIVRILGRLVSRLLPKGPAAERLLTMRRIERVGHEFSWAVSGVMLVFALLLSLHIVTHALKVEVVDWASTAIRDHAYVYTRGTSVIPGPILSGLPEHIVRARFSHRTPWPNPLIAVDPPDLLRFAHASRQDKAVAAIAEKLGSGNVILSTMMARRFGLGVGDSLEVTSRSAIRRLEVIGVTDRIGYMPMIGPYRNSKTYGVIGAADFDLIAPYAAPIGASVALTDPTWRSGVPPKFWEGLLGHLSNQRGLFVEIGSAFEADRVTETDRDFAIFDVILLLTVVLAAVGIANHLVLSAHVRRRETALYRVLGMEVDQLRTLFLMEGAIIGLLGGLLAVVLGIPLGFSAIQALGFVSAFTVRFELPPLYILVTLIGAVVISIVASVYPALRASAFADTESVHYE